jgi:hypothetical protein
MENTKKIFKTHHSDPTCNDFLFGSSLIRILEIHPLNMRGGRNVENQNVERSERRKYLLGWSERQKIRTSKIRMS